MSSRADKPRLPTDPGERKKIALSLVLDYFGDALCEVAEVIMAGQAQHGTSGWDRTKSTDHEDCYLRHFMDRGTIDVDNIPHTAKASWRQLAMHQLEAEERKGLPPSRGTSVPAAKKPEPILAPKMPEAVKQAIQLELPFTKKSLFIRDLAGLLPGTQLRVTGLPGWAKPDGGGVIRMGEILAFVVLRDNIAHFNFVLLDRTYGGSVSLSDPGWRFEIV